MRVVIAMLLLATVAHVEPERSPYALRLDIDASLLARGAWGGTSFIGGAEVAPPWCGTMTTAPCDPGALDALDRPAVGLASDGARLGANVVAGVLPAAFAVRCAARGPSCTSPGSSRRCARAPRPASRSSAGTRRTRSHRASCSPRCADGTCRCASCRR